MFFQKISVYLHWNKQSDTNMQKQMEEKGITLEDLLWAKMTDYMQTMGRYLEKEYAKKKRMGKSFTAEDIEEMTRQIKRDLKVITDK